MYVDGIILFALYILASSSLILGIYNNIELRDLIKKLNKKPKVKQPMPEIKIKRPKGYWD